MVQDPGLHDLPGVSQMLASVDSENVVWPQDIECHHLSSHCLKMLGSVREVVLALGVAGADLIESVPQHRQLEHVAARVDLAQRALLRRAVALLDDAQEPAGRVAEDPSEAHRVFHDGGAQEASGPVQMPALEQVRQRLRTQQRLVSDQDKRGPLVAGQERTTHLDGVSSAKLLGLRGEEYIGLIAEEVVNLFGRIADHDHDASLPRPRAASTT